MKLCPRCGTWHMVAPIPERCTSCNAWLKAVVTRPPIGEPISGAPIEAEDAGLGRGLIDGAIRTMAREVE